MKSKDLVGTQGVGMKQENLGSVHNKSLIWVLQLTNKILCSVKYKCLQRIAVQLSKKLYTTRGTRVPLKWESQRGGKCEKTNLIKSKKVVSI